MNIRWIVVLDEDERDRIEVLISGGELGARKLKRAITLRMANDGWEDEAIAKALGLGTSTVYRTKRRYVELGLDAALSEAPRPGGERKLSGNEEATLIALACSTPPEGRSKWTMQLLADKLVVLTDLDSLSAETVRRRLNENELKPWQQKMWCIGEVTPEYVARMEDVLDLYGQPADPTRPVVCFDESPVQLIDETRVPIPVAAGKPHRIDYEYRRNGTANLFVFVDRHRGWRNVDVTERRTNADFADQMQHLVDDHYPDAEEIRVVLDNLNTHKAASLYEAFEPAEARRILRKLRFHFTPKHGSWLNMAEIEIGVLNRQCLDRRIPDRNILAREINAWQRSRNAEGATINWMFDVDSAREKFKRRYPAPSRPLQAESDRKAA